MLKIRYYESGYAYDYTKKHIMLYNSQNMNQLNHLMTAIMDNKIHIADSFKIFEPNSKLDIIHDMLKHIDMSGHVLVTLNDASRMNKYVNVSRAKIYIQMLKVFEDGNLHHYSDIYDLLFKPNNCNYGHDMDLFKMLRSTGMIGNETKGARGKLFYSITPFGKKILEMADINEAAYRIIRHFTSDPDLAREKFMHEDLMGIGQSWNDLTEDSLKEMLESVFSPNGKIFGIKSHHYWVNKIIKCYKTSDEFRAMFTPSIKAMMENMATNNVYMSRFLKLTNKVDKKLGTPIV